MKTKKRTRKLRLYSKNSPRMPKPVSAKKDKGFSLRLIWNTNSRFAVVKQMHKSLDQFMEETGADTLAKKWLAARAVFLVSLLESMELDALEGTPFEWKRHLSTTKNLADILSRLGLDREAKSAERLHDYLDDGRSHKKKR